MTSFTKKQQSPLALRHQTRLNFFSLINDQWNIKCTTLYHVTDLAVSPLVQEDQSFSAAALYQDVDVTYDFAFVVTNQGI